MEDDFDLEGLSPAEARAYVAGFITTQKQVARDRAAAEDELSLWKKRTALAAERGESELARESLARAEQCHEKALKLRREQHDIDFKVTELKRRLEKVRTQPEVSIDAGSLLDQLESVVGTDHETNDALTVAAAEVALEQLKKKMESEDAVE